MKKILLLSMLIYLFGCQPSPKIANDVDSILDEFEAQLQKDVEDDNLIGSISMALVKGNKIIRSKAFGVSDLNNTQADTNSIYRIGSISKTFTAFLLMQLVQDGILLLDDEVEKYLPEVRDIQGYSDSTKFTFRELANHTSGLAHLPNLPFSIGSVDIWESRLLEALPATKLIAKPGERYSYSNIGFGILGLALSHAANKPFIEMVENRIFEPLGMNNSFYEEPDGNREQNLAYGRLGGPLGNTNDQIARERLKGRGWSVPNGGIFSTANDLAKFMMCNMGYCDILSKNNMTLMQTSQTPSKRWDTNYGIGFVLYEDNDIYTIGHEGGTAGYKGSFLFEKDSEYGVILLRNYDWGNTHLRLRPTSLLRKLKVASELK